MIAFKTSAPLTEVELRGLCKTVNSFRRYECVRFAVAGVMMIYVKIIFLLLETVLTDQLRLSLYNVSRQFKEQYDVVIFTRHEDTNSSLRDLLKKKRFRSVGTFIQMKFWSFTLEESSCIWWREQTTSVIHWYLWYSMISRIQRDTYQNDYIQTWFSDRNSTDLLSARQIVTRLSIKKRRWRPRSLILRTKCRSIHSFTEVPIEESSSNGLLDP